MGDEIRRRLTSLSLAQAKESKQPAWAMDADKAFFFDGAGFWRLAGAKWMAVGDQLPETGWQHRCECMCSLCRPADSPS